LREGFGGEPGDENDRSVGGARSGVEVAGPELEVIAIGEEALDLRPLPFGIGAEECEEVAIGYGCLIEEKGRDLDLLGVRFGAEKRGVTAGWNEGHPIRHLHKALARANAAERRAEAGEESEKRCGKI
jgi:hypothetical protein